jgi:hypothetical protein
MLILSSIIKAGRGPVTVVLVSVSMTRQELLRPPFRPAQIISQVSAAPDKIPRRIFLTAGDMRPFRFSLF